MRIHSKSLGKALAISAFLLQVFLFLGLAEAKPKSKQKTSPATKEDIFLYRGLGSSYLCNALSAGVEFPKSVGISAATYVQVLKGRHDGFVSSAGRKKLSNEQLFNGAEYQIITGALQYCPDKVPDDVKAKVEESLKNQNKKKKR